MAAAMTDELVDETLLGEDGLLVIREKQEQFLLGEGEIGPGLVTGGANGCHFLGDVRIGCLGILQRRLKSREGHQDRIGSTAGSAKATRPTGTTASAAASSAPATTLKVTTGAKAAVGWAKSTALTKSLRGAKSFRATGATRSATRAEISTASKTLTFRTAGATRSTRTKATASATVSATATPATAVGGGAFEGIVSTARATSAASATKSALHGLRAIRRQGRIRRLTRNHHLAELLADHLPLFIRRLNLRLHFRDAEHVAAAHSSSTTAAAATLSEGREGRNKQDRRQKEGQGRFLTHG